MFGLNYLKIAMKLSDSLVSRLTCLGVTFYCVALLATLIQLLDAENPDLAFPRVQIETQFCRLVLDLCSTTITVCSIVKILKQSPSSAPACRPCLIGLMLCQTCGLVFGFCSLLIQFDFRLILTVFIVQTIVDMAF